MENDKKEILKIYDIKRRNINAQYLIISSGRGLNLQSAAWYLQENVYHAFQFPWHGTCKVLRR